MEIPEKYLFSKRHKALLEKARELGYDGFWKYPGIKDNTRCHFDISMEIMFDNGVPCAFAGSSDPMQEYLDLQFISAVNDLATHCARIGILPLNLPGVNVSEVDGEKTVLIKPKFLPSVLKTILEL
jgi:hypothetical protein